MHPYRSAPSAPRAPSPPEEWVTIWLLVLLGGARVVLAVASGERFDTEATLALLMFCLGVLWGMQRFRKRSGDLHDPPPTDEWDP